MDHLDCPAEDLWKEREAWFNATCEEIQGQAAYFTSEQACAVCADVQAAFCAGAWVAVIVLAVSVADASLRETELPGFRGNTQKLFDAAGCDTEFHELRLLRNRIIHLDPEDPAITVDDQWFKRADWEFKARNAVTLMFRAMFIGPWL